jgi:RNA polymerase sigma-70 factor (ECF subfamily)
MEDAHPETAEQQVNPGASHAEQRLISLAKSGDTSAFTELYRLHARRALIAVRRITKNQEDAEDALQEASIKAFLHLRGFDERSKFSTWFTRIAVNSALMILRKRCGRIGLAIESEYEAGLFNTYHPVDDSPDPEHRVLATERDTQLSRAMMLLPWALRESLQLQLKEEISVKDLAVRLGISVSAAKSRLFRARALTRESVVSRNGIGVA